MNTENEQTASQQEALELVNNYLASKYGKRRRFLSLASACSVAAIFISLFLLLLNYSRQIKIKNELTAALNSEKNKAAALLAIKSEYSPDTRIGSSSALMGFGETDEPSDYSSFSGKATPPNKSYREELALMNDYAVELCGRNKNLEAIIKKQKVEIKNRNITLANKVKLATELRRQAASNDQRLSIANDSLVSLVARVNTLKGFHDQLAAYSRKAQSYDSLIRKFNLANSTGSDEFTTPIMERVMDKRSMKSSRMKSSKASKMKGKM